MYKHILVEKVKTNKKQTYLHIKFFGGACTNFSSLLWGNKKYSYNQFFTVILLTTLISKRGLIFIQMLFM